ncbi:MAG: hypothetical protein U5K29_13070 [Acidimicrobiales bacterium]|nr:hypothetical protein [Acidimicrobiales bacterium]
MLDDLVTEHGSIAQILFDAGATLGQIDSIVARFAPDDDAGVPQFIYSMEGHDVTGNGEPGIDIADWYLGELDTTLLPGLIDGALPCGLTGTRVVVCPEGRSDVPEGPVVVAAMRLAGPVPLSGSDRQYIYSAVFETDGDPTNDWMPQDPYGWDYFQGTDRWFEGFGMLSSQQWELDVVAVSSTQQQSIAPSDAVLVVDGDAAAFFIPAGEVGGTDGLCGRLTAFVTDGSYSPEASAGDISGGAPTAPLWNLEGAEC